MWETAVAEVQAASRRCILRAFVGRGLLDSGDARIWLRNRHRTMRSISASIGDRHNRRF